MQNVVKMKIKLFSNFTNCKLDVFLTIKKVSRPMAIYAECITFVEKFGEIAF